MTRAESVRVAYPLFQAEGGGSTPTSALQLRVEEIPMIDARKLNRLWHSVLPKTDLGNLLRNSHSLAYAAEFGGLFYAVAIWTTPIAANRLKNGWASLELRRLAIASDAPKNTASRMLGIMARLIGKKWPEIQTLVSYQAEKHHAGTIYKAAGWTRAATSKATVWHPDKTRAPMQTDSAKVRWEKSIINKVSQCALSVNDSSLGSGATHPTSAIAPSVKDSANATGNGVQPAFPDCTTESVDTRDVWGGTP